MESGGYIYSLAVYRILPSDSGDMTLLDRLQLWEDGPWSGCPRVDSHSRRVFVPCPGTGVTVAHLDGERLVRERTLTCVKGAESVDVMSSNIIYVRDGSSVHVVDVRGDKKMLTLERPETVKSYDRPYRLAVLCHCVMVSYGYTERHLVVYSHGSPTPVSVIPCPEGLDEVTAVSTDCQRHFLVIVSTTKSDSTSKSMLVTHVNGKICHTVDILTDRYIRDCAVINRQLWVGCLNGNIVIMSSQ